MPKPTQTVHAITVIPEGAMIEYIWSRKSIRNINMRIDEDGTLRVSTPWSTAKEELDDLIVEKMDWIQEARARQAQREVLPVEVDRRKVIAHFEASLDRMMLLIRDAGISRPELRVRRMKSRWGSCIPARGRIWINSALYAADLALLDYVILHELAHLRHANHGKEFWDFVAKYMPDWRERRAALSQYRLG